jgi:hypothetical protein
MPLLPPFSLSLVHEHASERDLFSPQLSAGHGQTQRCVSLHCPAAVTRAGGHPHKAVLLLAPAHE